jgi:hypothetical protein
LFESNTLAIIYAVMIYTSGDKSNKSVQVTILLVEGEAEQLRPLINENRIRKKM